MKQFLLAVAFVLVCVPAFAQGSGVSTSDREAFLQGQLDAERAASVGNRLDSYCAGWYDFMSSRTPMGLAFVPSECDQFWTYEEIYGPTFWAPQFYPTWRASFRLHFGRYNHYGWTNHDRDDRLRHYHQPPNVGARGEGHAGREGSRGSGRGNPPNQGRARSNDTGRRTAPQGHTGQSGQNGQHGRGRK